MVYFKKWKAAEFALTNLFKSNTDHDTLNRTKFNSVTWILCISCFYFFFPCLPSSICLWVIVHYMVSIQETLSSVYKIVNSRLHSSKELKCYLHRWDISCPTYYVHAMVVGQQINVNLIPIYHEAIEEFWLNIKLLQNWYCLDVVRWCDSFNS